MIRRDLSMMGIDGIPCGGDGLIDIPSVETHMMLYTSPIIELDYAGLGYRQISLIGERSKLGLISKSRIDMIELDPSLSKYSMKMSLSEMPLTFNLNLYISGVKGEIVEFTWMDSFQNDDDKLGHIFSQECEIREDNSSVYVIKFPFNSMSYAECR